MPHYRIETHAHTNTVSPCGQLSPAELAAGCVAAGYSGLVVTDHLVHWLPVFDGLEAWPDRVHAYFSGYRAARDAARARSIPRCSTVWKCTTGIPDTIRATIQPQTSHRGTGYSKSAARTLTRPKTSGALGSRYPRCPRRFTT